MNRKLIFAVAAASALLLSSCRKADEVTPSESQFDELEFTATIDGPSTKTTVNTNGVDTKNRGKIEWVAGDEITITDANNTSVVYVTEEGDGKFRKKAGQTGRRLAYDSKYSATYGTKPSKSQKYADYYGGVNQAKNVYMEALESENRSLKFTAAYGLLKLTLIADNAKESITKIKVTGNTGEYTLDCGTTGVSTKYGGYDGVFYLSLPDGTYTKMVFCNVDGIECEVTGSSKIEKNKIQPVTINVTFTKPDPIFSVSGSKQVQFTKGNLWYGTKKMDGTAVSEGWHLESSQTAYPTSRNTDHVGHFFWSKYASVAYAASYSDESASPTDKFFCGADNPLTVDGQVGLYALTKDEWIYLLGTSTERSGKHKYGVTVNNVRNCLVIAPDWYTGKIATLYDADAWAKAEESGFVCLPAAGYWFYQQQKLNNGGSYGNYWSADGDNMYRAYYLFFKSSSVNPADCDSRDYGYSVRLVYSVSK